ncbi:MAG: nicotinamide-nucleotide amidohydrolase family protein [Treponema sp.]|jgi:PncC family amidohydrolase|nr:nicotinamide-nucleotide amidohydrolase family protein [Treponema sp.]
MAEVSAEAVIRGLSAASRFLVAAESCTAGLVADLLARVPGASRVFWGSFVSYTVNAKERMLGIDPELIRRFGAVSRETAEAMARGALARSGADLAVAVTGLAGPGGDGTSVPAGTVWIAVARQGGEGEAAVFRYAGSRNEVRAFAASEALGMLLRHIN